MGEVRGTTPRRNALAILHDGYEIYSCRTFTLNLIIIINPVGQFVVSGSQTTSQTSQVFMNNKTMMKL